MLRQIRSSMAAPTKPWHFLIAILFYALIWIVVAYGFNLLGHRFGWSLWANKRFSLGETIVTGIVWSIAMGAYSFWRLPKRETT
jgi:hypothetical protein